MQFSVTEDLSMTKIENHGVGWAMHVYGTSESDTGMIYYKTCLGVFKCTMCDFVEWPCQPLATRKNTKPQEPRKHCLQHGSLGEWQQCDATLKVHVPHQHMDEPVVITFTHVGLHQHPRPPPICPDGIGCQTLDGVVNIAPELPPKNLQVGTATRKPAPEFHPAYANLDCISNHRRHTISKHAPGNTLGDLSAYEMEIDDDFIQSSSMVRRNQHFLIQTLFFQEEYIHTLKECMQSDSIHGWIVDGKHNDMNLTVTSTFCPAIKRTVPVLISVMHGKSSVHYEQHFLALLQSLPYATWDDFQENFPGMTCDFSDALWIGFKDALQNFYHIAAETNITLERFYRFCHVHYKHSLTRVHWNHGVIPAAEENEFYKLGLCLLEVETESELEDVVQKILRQYPNSKNWIEWYLHPLRARHIFPAMAIHDYSAMAKDTNAQESIRGDIKCTSGKKKISVVEAGHHAVAYMHRIEEDCQLAMTGAQLWYKKKQENSKQKSKMEGWWGIQQWWQGTRHNKITCQHIKTNQDEGWAPQREQKQSVKTGDQLENLWHSLVIYTQWVYRTKHLSTGYNSHCLVSFIQTSWSMVATHNCRFWCWSDPFCCFGAHGSRRIWPCTLVMVHQGHGLWTHQEPWPLSQHGRCVPWLSPRAHMLWCQDEITLQVLRLPRALPHGEEVTICTCSTQCTHYPAFSGHVFDPCQLRMFCTSGEGRRTLTQLQLMPADNIDAWHWYLDYIWVYLRKPW